MAGSRWSAESDMDYYHGDPRDQPVRCATRGCPNTTTFPFDSFCHECISMQTLEQEQIAAALTAAQRLKARPA